jgi:arylsulfatase A-like enzyme
LPTALAAAGSKIESEWKLDGVNLLPYLEGKKKTPHEVLFWRFGEQMAIRKGDWKLVKAPGSGAESAERHGAATTGGAHLYNLAQDVGEQTNLADQEPEKVKRLSTVWEKWNSELEEPRWTPNRVRRNRNR